LEKAISESLEPEDEELIPKYYKIVEQLEDQKKKGFVLRSGGKLQPLPDFNKIEKIYISGISGSGKSTFASNFVKEYKTAKRKNEFFVVSNVEEDGVIDKLKPIRIDLEDEEALSEVRSDDFYDSIILFDDIDTISNGLVRKFVQHLRDDLLECGRHYNTTVVAVSHVLQNYQATRKLLNEATTVVFFPKVGSNNHNYKFLKQHCLYDEDTIRRLLNLNSRWVALYRTHPNYVIYEKGVFLI
jgi:molybdopterin converting factor small subunit